MFRRLLPFAALLLLPLAACTATGDDGRPTVVASFYPLQYVVEQLAGDRVRVVNLTAPGVEPHDLDPTVKQIAEISDADLVVYEHGLAPAVDKAVSSNAAKQGLSVNKYVDLDGDNPHFWLDPLRLAKAAVAIEKRLETIDPSHAATFAANLTRLGEQLRTLDGEYTAGLAHCARHLVVTTHDAFGYQKRYGLEFAPIAGLSPDAEPSPKHLNQLRDLIRTARITTVFSETIASPKMAHTLAHDLGLNAEVLDPIEGVAKGSSADYQSIMRTNLATLEKANACATQ
jgi:zinc transport system substrate-binding protein